MCHLHLSRCKVSWAPSLLHHCLALWRGVLYQNMGGGSWEMILQRQQIQEGGTWCCLMSTPQPIPQ